MTTDKERYERTKRILKYLIRATYSDRRCLICGANQHVGHMECEVEIADKDLNDLIKEK